MEEIIFKGLTILASGGVLGIIVKSFFERKKTDAEATSIEASADVSIAETALRYANELKKDMAAFKAQIASLEAKVSAQAQEIQQLEVDNKNLRTENHELRTLIQKLQPQT